MKSLLAKIAFRKAVGLCVGEHEVSVCVVASTPLGPVQVASSSEPYTPEDLASVIERLLTPVIGKRHRLPVAVGLPSSRIFFNTRPVAVGGATTPQAMLQKALCSSNIAVDDLSVDLLHADISKTAVTSVAACRKKYMANLVAILNRMSVRLDRTEPSPCALVRAAAKSHRLPRRSKTLLQVFLNATQGLAVVSAGDVPLAWRTFPLSAGMEGFAILSAARTLVTQHKHYGMESELDYAIIYGRADIHERLQKEQFPSDIGTRVIWYDGPAFDGMATAYGLALGCLAQEITAFDLSKTLKAPASLWEIFPWWDLAFVGVLVLGMGLVLGYHSVQLNQAYTMLQVECSQHKCLASGEAGHLDKDRKELVEKVNAVRKFLESRVQWTAYNCDVATRFPANATLDAMECKSSLAMDGKNSFVLRGKAPLALDETTPGEIDILLSELRKDSVLSREFGAIELLGLKRIPPGPSGRTEASFTITCLLGKGGSPGAKGGGSGKPKK